MIIDKATSLQILGSLMKNPKFLSEVDKYNLTPADFNSTFERNIFIAIHSLYTNGANRISVVDIDNFLETNTTAKAAFNKENGIEYLQDAEYYAEEMNFQYYYSKLKKINLLNDLKRMGIDISEFYMEDLTNERAFDINKNFEQLTIEDILTAVKKKFLVAEKKYLQNSNIETWDVDKEIDDVIGSFGDPEEIGIPINGEIFSTIVNGAEIGALTIRSLCSGGGKTRLAIADACRLAFPFYFDLDNQKWVKTGASEPTLFIMTEQKPEQIIKMMIAYISGVDEGKFRYNTTTQEEKKRIAIARNIIHDFNNLKLMRMPDPTIDQLKLTLREEVITTGVQYVFFDYIFISPALLTEFRGYNLRNDELLLLMATALKDLAIEQDICVFSSTQVNGKADDNKEIRNESSLAGGRATINKADNGIIGALPTKDEIDILTRDGKIVGGIIPNRVFDVFKVRSGRWTQVRIWSYLDLGTLRLKDLFLTDSRMNVIQDFFNETRKFDWELNDYEKEYLERINKQ